GGGRGEGGGRGGGEDIGRDDRVGGVAQVVLERPLGRRLERRVDLGRGDLAFQLRDQVGDRPVNNRHPHRDAVHPALEFGEHQRGGLRGAGGGGDDVLRGGPGPAQVPVLEVLQHLVGGVGVDGGHQAPDDAEAVGQHLGHRPDAVGGGGGGRDDVVPRGVVAVVVDAHHDRDVLALGRGGDDHLPRARGEVGRRGVAGGEPAGGLDHHVDAEFAPGQ